MAKFCSTCGKDVHEEAVICTGCGCEVAKPQNNKDASWVATLLFCLFLGGLGAHRFYTKHTGTAILQLILTLSFFGLLISGPWTLIDFIMILTNNFKTKDGRDLAK